MADSPVEGRGFTLDQLFSQQRFKLDYYQREYMWSREDVASLVSDLYRRFASGWDVRHGREQTAGYPAYFLGSFVYFDGGGTTYLVDGQQRVTTLHLLLLHIRRLLAEQGEEHTDDVGELDKLIRRVRHGKRTYTVDIEERQPLLDSIYRGWPYELPENPTPSVRNLYERARDLEADFPAELRDESLVHFLDWLRDRVCLVGIKALDRDHGWEIFETMNDRGSRLDPVDLLKSHLLAKAAVRHEELNAAWRAMLARLTAFHRRTPSDFVKDLLIAEYADLSRGGEHADATVIRRAAHEWVRDHTSDMGLRSADDFQAFVERDVCGLAERYATLMAACEKPDHGLEAVFYNAVNGIGVQTIAILAAVRPEDTATVFREKAGLVASAIDLMYVRRFINGTARQAADMDEAVYELVPGLRACATTDEVRGLLGTAIAVMEEGMDGITSTNFGLRPGNAAQVRYLLARITAFAERECGRRDDIAAYLDAGRPRPYEIEHVWADKFERYQSEANTKTRFDALRNRLGALLLLPKPDNASFGDDRHGEKVVHYQRQNILAASLHPDSYRRNPGFRKFRKNKEYRLEDLFRAYPGDADFSRTAIEERQKLYQRLCELVWAPERLGLPLLPTRADKRKRTALRTRAYYDVSIPQLMEAGLLKAGDELTGRHKGVVHHAHLLPDGRIKVESGEVFTAVSPAAMFVMGRGSANGWTFWHAAADGGEPVLLKSLRDDLLRSGALEQG